MRLLAKARPAALHTLSLARSTLRGPDLAPLCEWLQGGPSGSPRCGLLALNLRYNRLADAGAQQLLESLCLGGKSGGCVLRSLDLAGNQLTVGVIDHVSKLVSSLTSLFELSLLDNAFVAGLTVVNGLRGALPPVEAIRALPGLFSKLRAAMHAGSKSKDLLIAVLSTTSLCELQVDGGFFAAQDAARLQERLAKNRELRLSSLDHSHLGADAPPTSSASGGGGGRARPTGGVGEGHSWGGLNASGRPRKRCRWLRRRPGARARSALLVCQDPSGQVVPVDMLDLDKERELICDSMCEARRDLKVRFE